MTGVSRAEDWGGAVFGRMSLMGRGGRAGLDVGQRRGGVIKRNEGGGRGGDGGVWTSWEGLRGRDKGKRECTGVGLVACMDGTVL